MSGTDFLAEATDELYGSDPEGFTERRAALAAQARAAGDRPAARQIAGLRKPTRPAWIINQLVRDDPGVAARLTGLGDDLRAAAAALDGAKIRELSQARRRLIDSLIRQALQQAGEQSPPAALREDLTATFGAALADPEVARDLAAGTLLRAVHRADFSAGIPELSLVPPVADTAQTTQGRPAPGTGRGRRGPPGRRRRLLTRGRPDRRRPGTPGRLITSRALRRPGSPGRPVPRRPVKPGPATRPGRPPPRRRGRRRRSGPRRSGGGLSPTRNRPSPTRPRRPTRRLRPSGTSGARSGPSRTSSTRPAASSPGPGAESARRRPPGRRRSGPCAASRRRGSTAAGHRGHAAGALQGAAAGRGRGGPEQRGGGRYSTTRRASRRFPPCCWTSANHSGSRPSTVPAASASPTYSG